MRTVIDVRTITDHFPGIGRYTFHLVRALARQENPGDLVLLSNAKQPNTRFDLSALASEQSIRIVSTDALPFTAREQLLLPGELRRLAPVVTHFPYMVMPYLAPGPVVLTIHDIIPLRVPHFFTLRQRVLYRASLRMALHAAAIVICISEATRSDLESRLHVTPSRLVVIREGAGESFRPSRNEEVHRLLDKYQIPDPYLLYVGSNKPHKNLPVLIESFAQLRTPISLVLAGNMDPRFDLAQRKIEEIGIGSRIRFLGAVKEDELPALYSGARAFVFPSLQEGFGLPPLEAIACGTPAVCSDIPSLRETMGSAALFFDPKDRESLASALNRIATDESLRADLQTRGLQRAAELNWNVAAKKTMEVYRSLAGSG